MRNIEFKCFSQSANEIRSPNIIRPRQYHLELTKYGSVELNEFSEEIAASIALYNYKPGRLNLPIVMSYSGGVIKVNQLVVGLKLRGGGVISKTVKDKAKLLRKFYNQNSAK